MATYSRVNWANKAAGGTKLGATLLNVMDAGIDAVYDVATAAGDLIIGSAASTLDRLAKGSNDEVLSVNSGSLDYRKVVNAMVDSAAAIAYSKLNLTGSLVAADAAFATTSYTPTLGATTTDPTLGTGSAASGRYVQLGDLVWFQALVRFGTSGTNAGSGTYEVSYPPVAADGSDFPIGSAWILDSNTSNQYVATLDGSSTDGIRLRTQTGGLVTHASPIAFAASDDIRVGGWYVAA